MIKIEDQVVQPMRGVYCIWNYTRPDDWAYIGSSECIKQRVSVHVKDLILRRHVNKGLQADYDSGHDFYVSVIRSVHQLYNLRLIEQDRINEFRSLGFTLYNVGVAFAGDRKHEMNMSCRRFRDLTALYRTNPDLAVIGSEYRARMLGF